MILKNFFFLIKNHPILIINITLITPIVFILKSHYFSFKQLIVSMKVIFLKF